MSLLLGTINKYEIPEQNKSIIKSWENYNNTP